MITILSTPKHAYTHANLKKTDAFELQSMGYHRALSARQLPESTYIFTDLDRLNFWELELAGRLYRQLQHAGCRVLNDPATVRLRFSLLRALRRSGFNRFDAWRVEDRDRPAADHYPVFLRTESAHRGNLTDLLHDEAAVDTAVQDALKTGIPMRELILVQYCAQPTEQGYFCKYATFRVGKQTITTLPVHESGWSAKYGETGLGDAALYAAEHESLVANEYGPPLLAAFNEANIEFGRADFGLVDGRPQVYEINTNPMVGQRDIKHGDANRVASARVFFDRLCAAMAAIDTPASGRKVPIEDDKLVAQRRMDRYLLRPRWTP